MSDEVLPQTWANAPIGECCELNPKIDKSAFADSDTVHFVPMPAVEALTNKVDVSTTRPFSEVKKGYTPFTSGDVIFAKITPCMENGKIAVVPALSYKIAFGSTEFHVLRPRGGLDPLWFFYFLSSRSFRSLAEHNMTGAVGQRRVPVDFLARSTIPLPPLAEQKRIVAKIEELFSELEAGEESLRAARRQLGVYRQSLLKQAFEGKLTETWRAENPDKLESPAQLLARIQAARRAYYEQQLKDWECAIKVWSEAGQKGNRPRKPSEPMTLPLREFEGDITRPECWAIEQIGNCPTDALIGLVRSADEQTAGPSGFSYIKMDRVDMQGNVDISPSVFVDCTPEEVERFALKKGDILFNTRNSVELVGKVGTVRREPNSPTVYNNNLMRIRLPDCFDSVFVGLQLCAQPFRQRMDRIKKATTSVAAVYAKDFWPLTLAISSLPEQQEIVRLLDEQFEAIERNEREIDAALKRSEALRQAILKKAFTGQLVPQDPADEPASALLERLAKEQINTNSRPRRKRPQKEVLS